MQGMVCNDKPLGGDIGGETAQPPRIELFERVVLLRR